MPDLILFDLDGTLSDPALGITNSILHVLHKHGLDASRQDLLPFIGPPLMESFARYYPMLDPRQSLEEFREYFSTKGIYENELFADTRNALSTLKEAGYPLVVATSKPEEYAKTIIDYFELTPFFEGVYGADMDETRVAKAEIIAYALEETARKIPFSSPLMVGDRRHDIEGAHANHIPAAGILCGYGSKDELKEAKADWIVSNLEDLAELLQNLKDKHTKSK